MESTQNPEVGGGTYLSREAYKNFAENDDEHTHLISSSWYYLVNEFVYKKGPENRRSYASMPRYAKGFPIAIEFAKHPDFDHHWSDTEVADVDELDLDSLAKYLSDASIAAAEAGVEVHKFLGRGCLKKMVGLWQSITAQSESRLQ